MERDGRVRRPAEGGEDPRPGAGVPQGALRPRRRPDAAAATSLQTFTGGVGDVLISYENEAIAAKAKGKDVEWIVPDRTILIENPIAVTTRSTNATAAKAFVDFLRTKPAQQIFARYG